MRRLQADILVVVGSLALFCACDQPIVEPTRPHGVAVEPGDLTSVISAQKVSLVIRHTTAEAPEVERFNALADQVSVLEWPGLAQPIAVRKTVRRAPPGPVPGRENWENHPSLIEIDPLAPLPQRWYVLRVGALPADFTWEPGPFTALPDGSRGFRFNFTSAPVPHSVRICRSATGYNRVHVAFSEVMAIQPGDLILQLGGTPCQLTDPGEPANKVSFSCPSLLFEGDEAILSFLPGLKGASGQPLTVTSSREALVKDRFTEESGTGCFIMRF